MSYVSLKIADTKESVRLAQQIRNIVFVKEQGIDADLDLDGQDDSADIILLYADDQPIGTGRIYYYQNNYQGHISRIAVLKEYRKNGYAKLIIRKLEEMALTKGVERIYLHPHKYLVDYYAGLEYKQVPNSHFNVAGHELIRMEKLIV